jgi:rubrerythrin
VRERNLDDRRSSGYAIEEKKAEAAMVKDEAKGKNDYLRMAAEADQEGRHEDAEKFRAHAADEKRHETEDKKILAHPDPPSSKSGVLKIKEVQVLRAEGPADECGKWRTFKNIDDANAYLSRNARGMPEEQQGYDKHDFKIIFSNGETYEGRYDVNRNESADIARHVENFRDYQKRIYADRKKTMSKQEEKSWDRVLKAVKPQSIK